MKKIATVLLSTCMLFAGGATLSGCGGHEHNFKTEWSTSISNHWHECECGEKKDNAEHNWKLFESISNTTHKKTCDCGASVTEEHNWNGGEITIFPTATTNGERTYTCTFCEQTKTEQISATTELVLTKSDLQMLFKTVAQNLWFNLDAGNPAAGATPLSVNLQTDFVEITDPAELKVLKADAATFTALVNMIGDYYANENFIVSDKALTFMVNTTHLSSQGTMDIELTILPVVDVQNNKITLEMLMVMPDLTTMYYNFDIDYNFVGTKNVTGFNMLVIQNKSSYIQQKMQDQKFYAVKTFTTAQKSAANQLQTNFLTKKTQGPTLQGNFSDEFNNYCIVANNAFENVMGGTTPEGPSGPSAPELTTSEWNDAMVISNNNCSVVQTVVYNGQTEDYIYKYADSKIYYQANSHIDGYGIYYTIENDSYFHYHYHTEKSSWEKLNATKQEYDSYLVKMDFTSVFAKDNFTINTKNGSYNSIADFTIGSTTYKNVSIIFENKKVSTITMTQTRGNASADLTINVNYNQTNIDIPQIESAMVDTDEWDMAMTINGDFVMTRSVQIGSINQTTTIIMADNLGKFGNTYFEKNGNKYYAYSNNGNGWTRTETTEQAFMSYRKYFNFLLGDFNSFTYDNNNQVYRCAQLDNWSDIVVRFDNGRLISFSATYIDDTIETYTISYTTETINLPTIG